MNIKHEYLLKYIYDYICINARNQLFHCNLEIWSSAPWKAEVLKLFLRRRMPFNFYVDEVAIEDAEPPKLLQSRHVLVRTMSAAAFLFFKFIEFLKGFAGSPAVDDAFLDVWSCPCT